jgi:hypothetical protein
VAVSVVFLTEAQAVQVVVLVMVVLVEHLLQVKGLLVEVTQ